MNCEGKVTLWIGNFDNAEELKEYVTLGYTADGDQIYSQFANEFDFGHTDDDSIEYVFFKCKINVISEVLSQFSYSEKIISEFIKLLEKEIFDKVINSVILLYDYVHKEDIVNGKNMVCIGSVDYYN